MLNVGEPNKKPHLRFGGQCGPNAPEDEVQMFYRGSEPARAGQESMKGRTCTSDHEAFEST